MQCLLPVKEICTKQLSINNGVCDGSENRKSAISFSGALRIPVSIFVISQTYDLSCTLLLSVAKVECNGDNSVNLSFLMSTS